MRTGWRRLILWDIDGTLAHSGTVATEIFSRAIEHVVGTTLSTTISFAGKTDRQITEEFLELAGSTDPGHVEIILDRVEIELAKRAERISADGTIFPGAKEAIEALSAFPEIAQTVLTGNIAANARLKPPRPRSWRVREGPHRPDEAPASRLAEPDRAPPPELHTG